MRPISIIGGGVAGLALGIALRQKEVPVVVFEAGQYPRHKVCGEFVSGRGLKVLDRLGLRETLRRRGARCLHRAAFVRAGMAPISQPLASESLALSRFEMDQALAEEFCRLGGELRLGMRHRSDGAAEGTVRASGRRPQIASNGWRWFGLKIHAFNFPLVADLEMQVGPAGYAGFCRLGDRVNICGLFRSRKPVPDLRESWLDWMVRLNEPGLGPRFAQATFDFESFSSVAGISLEPVRAAARKDFCIGDALTMIPPVTGNGMSMGFESADLASGPLTDYARGKISWDHARIEAATLCDGAFHRRLFWAFWLQTALGTGCGRATLGMVARIFPAVWRQIYQRTR